MHFENDCVIPLEWCLEVWFLLFRELSLTQLMWRELFLDVGDLGLAGPVLRDAPGPLLCASSASSLSCSALAWPFLAWPVAGSAVSNWRTVVVSCRSCPTLMSFWILETGAVVVGNLQTHSDFSDLYPNFWGSMVVLICLPSTTPTPGKKIYIFQKRWDPFLLAHGLGYLKGSSPNLWH